MRNRKRQKCQINYLDLIPERASGLGWREEPNEGIVLEVENTGVFHTIAQKVFHKPRFTMVHLDEQGTFLWPLIDGKRTVTELAALQKEKFGEAVEPLYPRIVKYFQIMESYHFIRFINKSE
ncbi:MAG: PqqD family protein [Clostridiales bacterium]|nr:PqqD family protein [Clostridiales bacterium]